MVTYVRHVRLLIRSEENLIDFGSLSAFLGNKIIWLNSVVTWHCFRLVDINCEFCIILLKFVSMLCFKIICQNWLPMLPLILTNVAEYICKQICIKVKHLQKCFLYLRLYLNYLFNVLLWLKRNLCLRLRQKCPVSGLCSSASLVLYNHIGGDGCNVNSIQEDINNKD